MKGDIGAPGGRRTSGIEGASATVVDGVRQLNDELDSLIRTVSTVRAQRLRQIALRRGG
jgi:hypothetical protein